MTVNYKSLHGPKLQAAGFKLVPIKAGTKQPMTRGWQNIRSTPADVAKWARSSYYGGIAVLGKFTPGIDVDVSDEDIANKIVAWCHENIGLTPVRLGNAPRVLLPYAAPEKGLGPDSSHKFKDELGVLHQVDVRATGQQWVAYGVHPGTGNPYTWLPNELSEYQPDFLPVLTGEKLQELFAYFESIVPTSWTRLSTGKKLHAGGFDATGSEMGLTSFENYKPPLNIDTDRLRSMLAALSPDGTVNGCGWRTVGMALYHQFEGSDEGKQLFTEWSENSVEYDYNEIQARWPSWASNTYGGNPVTAATIVSMYNSIVKEVDDPTKRLKSKNLSDWEQRFVLIEMPDGSEVHDAGVPIYMSPKRQLRAFKEHNAGYSHKYVTFDGDVKLEPMVDAWKASLNTRHYSGYTYQPGQPRFCTRGHNWGDDAMYVNTFYFPPHLEEVDNPEQKLSVFFKFLAHIFPIEDERNWIIEWLARMIQNPGKRSFVTPINITHVTGTGRGLFFEVLRALVGAHNTHDVSKDDIEGRFNGFLDKCMIAVIQEIKAATGDHKYQIWERMKSLLADTNANIQEKGKDSYTGTIYANFLMFSNNLNALPLDDVNERRIYAMQGAGEPIDHAGITAIINWKNGPENVAALFKFLQKYPVDESHFERAPVTETKKQMVNLSLGDEGVDVKNWILEEAPLVFDYEYAVSRVDAGHGTESDIFVSRKKLGLVLSDMGYHSRRVRIEGSRLYLYYDPRKTSSGTQNLKDLYYSLNRS